MADFDLKQNFPIQGVAQLYAERATKEAAMRAQQNQELVAGLNQFKSGVDSLVKRRQDMAQALAVGQVLGIPDSQSRTLGTPENVIGAYKAKSASDSKNSDTNFGRVLFLNHIREHPEVLNDPRTGALMQTLGFGGSPNVQQIPQALPQANPSAIPVNAPDMGSPTSNISADPGTAANPAMLTSDSTVLPPPPQPPINTNPLSLLSNMKMTKGDAAMLKTLMANAPQKVVSNTDALAAGYEPKGTHYVQSQVDKTDPGTPAYDKNQEKLENQYTQLKAKALSNRSGGLGLEDSKVNQAIHLRRLVNQSYDPKTGTYNIPKNYYGELVNGLATLTSPNGRPGIEIMHELQQKTAKGDLGGALAYMGFTDSNGNVPTGSTQSVLKLLVDSIDRQGDQAEQNRSGYFDYIHGQAPSDLEPQRIAKHDKVGLNSYNEFLNKAPDHKAKSQSGLTPEEQAEFDRLDKKYGSR